MPRFYCPLPMVTGVELELPAGAARHVQVLRMQPGDGLSLFHGGLQAGGSGGEFDARITHMGRSNVRVEVGAHHAIEREAPRAIHLLAGITANERMDWLIEKATELGAASITPLLAERSVLKLKGERADKKRAHWQAIAIAACEQCGRNQVPLVAAAVDLAGWMKANAQDGETERLLLSLQAGSTPIRQWAEHTGTAVFLSGPEGGLSPAEEALALAQGFKPVSLGARVLRAETAALAALAALAVLS